MTDRHGVCGKKEHTVKGQLPGVLSGWRCPVAMAEAVCEQRPKGVKRQQAGLFSQKAPRREAPLGGYGMVVKTRVARWCGSVSHSVCCSHRGGIVPRATKTRSFPRCSHSRSVRIRASIFNNYMVQVLF